MTVSFLQNIKRGSIEAPTDLLVYDGNLYALNAVGDLYQFQAGAFVEVAQGLGFGNAMSTFPKLQGMDGHVYAIMGRNGSFDVALKKWTGGSGYTTINNFPTSHAVRGMAVHSGSMYFTVLSSSGGFQFVNLYSHTGSGTSITLQIAFNTGVSSSPFKHIYSFGGDLIFIKSAQAPTGSQSGAIWQWSTPPFLLVGGFSSSYRSFGASMLFQGNLYDVVDGLSSGFQVPGSSLSLRRWDGLGGWNNMAPLYESSRRIARAMFGDSARIYLIMLGSLMNDRLMYWKPGDSAYTPVEELPGSSFEAGAVFGGKLYLINTNGDIYSGAAVPNGSGPGGNGGIPPEQAGSYILPSSTGKLSHARMLTAFRSQFNAEKFHNVMKGAS